MNQRTATFLSICILVLALIPLGVAVFILGFALGDNPCILCWGQRIGMGLVAILGAFILRYGPRPKYIGLSVLTGAWGLYMAFRHAGSHFNGDIGQGFSLEILGAHTYAWSMFIFWVCVIAMGLLLFTLKEGELHREVRDLGRLGRATLRILLVVLVANVVQAFISVGPPPFVGPANPVRFSWNPRNWSWGLEEWGGRGPSLRGQWAIPKPDLANLNQDPAAGPFVGLPSLTVSTWLKLPSGIRNPSGLAWDEASQRFAVVTEGHCVYLLDAGLTGIQRWTCVDPTYDIDLGHGFVGVAFYGGGLMAIAENKSWTFLKEAPPDAKENWHSFLTNCAAFEEISRGEFTSVRARRSYISALAAGPSGLYLVPLPNNHQKNFVVSRFDPKDLMLAEEFVLTAPDLSFVRGRSLSDLAPVGLAVEGDRLLALSGSFSTLLEIDLKTHQVSRAWELQGLTRPTGLALRGTDLLVLCADGRVAVLPRP